MDLKNQEEDELLKGGVHQDISKEEEAYLLEGSGDEGQRSPKQAEATSAVANPLTSGPGTSPEPMDCSGPGPSRIAKGPEYEPGPPECVEKHCKLHRPGSSANSTSKKGKGKKSKVQFYKPGPKNFKRVYESGKDAQLIHLSGSSSSEKSVSPEKSKVKDGSTMVTTRSQAKRRRDAGGESPDDGGSGAAKFSASSNPKLRGVKGGIRKKSVAKDLKKRVVIQVFKEVARDLIVEAGMSRLEEEFREISGSSDSSVRIEDAGKAANRRPARAKIEPDKKAQNVKVKRSANQKAGSSDSDIQEIPVKKEAEEEDDEVRVIKVVAGPRSSPTETSRSKPRKPITWSLLEAERESNRIVRVFDSRIPADERPQPQGPKPRPPEAYQRSCEKVAEYLARQRAVESFRAAHRIPDQLEVTIRNRSPVAGPSGIVMKAEKRRNSIQDNPLYKAGRLQRVPEDFEDWPKPKNTTGWIIPGEEADRRPPPGHGSARTAKRRRQRAVNARIQANEPYYRHLVPPKDGPPDSEGEDDGESSRRRDH